MVAAEKRGNSFVPDFLDDRYGLLTRFRKETYPVCRSVPRLTLSAPPTGRAWGLAALFRKKEN